MRHSFSFFVLYKTENILTLKVIKRLSVRINDK